MARIIVISGHYPVYDNNGYDTGRKEFFASHGIYEDTMENVVLPNEHPRLLGAVWNSRIGEWVID